MRRLGYRMLQSGQSVLIESGKLQQDMGKKEWLAWVPRPALHRKVVIFTCPSGV